MLSSNVEFAIVSDPGLKRTHNEDSALADRSLGLALIADGMGGYKSGEVASAIAAQCVLEGIRENHNKHHFVRGTDEQKTSPEGLLIREVIRAANQRIFRTAHALPQCHGMGTTIVAALFSENRVTLAHVGDSRIYRFRNNQMSQVTNDHSLLQELIDRGFYTPEDARANTPKNLVTRALGIDEQVAVEVTEHATEEGDIFLLCSDGLNDMVEDEEISLTLGKYSANLLTCAKELVRLANQNGGKDNVSVVLARPRAPTNEGVSLLARLKKLLFRAS